MLVDPGGITGVAGRHHAFDDDHVVACAGLLIKRQDLFEQLVELAIAQHSLDVGQAQGLGRLQAMGARNQLGRAFRAQVAGVWLSDGLEKTDLQAGAFQGPYQPQADGGQAYAKVSRRDEESLHASFSGELWAARYKLHATARK